jgi:hypothetical protein
VKSPRRRYHLVGAQLALEPAEAGPQPPVLAEEPGDLLLQIQQAGRAVRLSPGVPEPEGRPSVAGWRGLTHHGPGVALAYRPGDSGGLLSLTTRGR